MRTSRPIEPTGLSDDPWKALLAIIRQFVALPDNLSPQDLIADIVGSDRLERAVLAGAIRFALKYPASELLHGIQTFGEAAEWYEVRRALDPSDPIPNVRRDSTRGASVRLRTLVDEDLPILYASAISPQWGHMWRYRGAVPSKEEFQQGLYIGTFTQYAIEDVATRSLIGWVGAYNARLEAGTIFIGFTRAAGSAHVLDTGMFEGMYLFINFLFDTWPLRKIYAEIAGFGWGQFAWGAGQLFQVEGVLSEHDFYDGKFWDQRIISFVREGWMRARETLLDPVFAEPSRLLMAGVRDEISATADLKGALEDTRQFHR